MFVANSATPAKRNALSSWWLWVLWSMVLSMYYVSICRKYRWICTWFIHTCFSLHFDVSTTHTFLHMDICRYLHLSQFVSIHIQNIICLCTRAGKLPCLQPQVLEWLHNGACCLADSPGSGVCLWEAETASCLHYSLIGRENSSRDAVQCRAASHTFFSVVSWLWRGTDSSVTHSITIQKWHEINEVKPEFCL